MEQAAGSGGGRKGGIVVLVVLGVIFLAILILILVNAGRSRPAVQQRAETLTVLPLRIRIRTEPNAKAPVVSTASQGAQLIVLEDRGSWVRVQDTEGLSGWAERNFLERTAERDRRLERFAAIRKLPALGGLARSRTQLFAGPGIFYPLVGELPEGTQVRVFTRDHDFYAIDHDSGVAYADIDAIDVSATGAPSLDVAPTSASNAPPPTATDTTATAAPPIPTETAATASTASVEPPPVPAPSEPPPGGGVYAVVPAGGTQPEEVDRVVPRYPPLARRANVAGAVVIRGIVRRDGTIDNVEIIKDLPYGLGDAARDAVSRWRFRPATYRGEPIDVYYTVTVNFRLQ
ncbi:MAG: TonB family protein [Acidobacteria bacterium]|nr:TonB family protein [Acidobacteriota bacterium]